MFSHLLKFQLFISILLVTIIPGISQDTLVTEDSAVNLSEDSLIVPQDTIFSDTTQNKINKKTTPIEYPVTYNAVDSMIISIQDKKLFLFGSAKVNYQDIELNADYIEFDMADNIVMAAGDTIGESNEKGKPVFKQGEEEFTSDTIKYNFKTKKGIIKQIVTQQGDGFLLAERTKRHTDGHIHIKNGRYTTCDASHPHFYIGLTKAIVIPNDKIVSGPAYFVMEDIPLPLVLPFGFFPNSKNRSAGILIPTYGESRLLGFYLTNGGFYIPINEYLDIAVQGDIYSRGTWGAIARANYYWKYHFRGSFEGKMYFNRVNDDKKFAKSNDYSIRWNHNQDAKANPTRTFSANVSVRSSSYSKNYSNNLQDYIETSSSQNSSISYSKQFGNFLSINAALNYSQDNSNNTVNMNFPSASISIMQPIYPFRRKNMTGKPKWFENIKIDYNAELDNQIKTNTDDLFDPVTVKNMKYGYKHSIPISLTNFKLLKLINITPSLSYSGSLNGMHIEKRLADSVFYGSTLINSIEIDTIRKITYAHSITPGISFSINPKFYGMFQSKNPNSYIQALRHVITPSAGWGYSPDMSKILPDYKQTIAYSRSITESYQESEYSIYERSLYPVSVSDGSLREISLGLSNNLEMKVLEKNDTVNEFKKVPLLSTLNFNTSYNPFIDSLRWRDISMNGSTGFFENKVSLNFTGGFSPYALNKNGQRYNTSYFKEKGKILRLTNLQLTMSVNFSSNAGKKKSAEQDAEQKGADIRNDIVPYTGYVDFSIPWSFNINYSWTYFKQINQNIVTHSIRLNGDLSLTKMWKIGGNIYYDLELKELIAVNLSISRDLHCWEMYMSIVPFGPNRNYSFRINAKNSILQDLKWDKRKNWYDY